MEYRFFEKITLNEYIQDCTDYMKNPFWSKFTYIIYFVCIGYMFITTISIIKNNIGIVSLREIIINKYFLFIMLLIFILVVLFIIFEKMVIPHMYKFICRKYYNKYFNNGLINYIINENEIKIIAGNLNKILTKKNILKIKYENDSICIFSLTFMIIIIKEKYINDLNQFSELITFVKNNYDKK